MVMYWAAAEELIFFESVASGTYTPKVENDKVDQLSVTRGNYQYLKLCRNYKGWFKLKISDGMFVRWDTMSLKFSSPPRSSWKG